MYEEAKKVGNRLFIIEYRSIGLADLMEWRIEDEPFVDFSDIFEKIEKSKESEPDFDAIELLIQIKLCIVKN